MKEEKKKQSILFPKGILRRHERGVQKNFSYVKGRRKKPGNSTHLTYSRGEKIG